MAYRDLILAQGAAAYWPMDEASGSSAAELVAGRTGAYNVGTPGGAGFTDAAFSGVLPYSSGARLAVPNDALFNPGYASDPPAGGDTQLPFSVSAWILVVNAGNSYKGIMVKGVGSNLWWLGIYAPGGGNGNALYSRFSSGFGNLETLGGAIPVGGWSHVGMTRDSSTAVKVYLNGLQTAQAASTPNMYDTAGELSIGGGSAGFSDSYPLDGRMCHAAFFARVLSASEMMDQWVLGSGFRRRSVTLPGRVAAMRAAGY